MRTITLGRKDRHHLKVIAICASAVEVAIMDKRKDMLASATVRLENDDYYISDVVSVDCLINFEDARDIVLRLMTPTRLARIIESDQEV